MADALFIHPHAIVKGRFRDPSGAFPHELVNPPLSLEAGDRIIWAENARALRFVKGKHPWIDGPLRIVYVTWVGEPGREGLERIVALQDPIEIAPPVDRAGAFAAVCALAYGLATVLVESHEDGLVVWTVA
jgi:hypothetical protein